MAYSVTITVPPQIVARLTDGNILHVTFYGENETDYRVEYKKLEKTLLFEYLKRKDWPSICERLMAVTFETPMWQAENSKDVLKRNIFCDGKYFRFLGHSESQLSEKTCYLINASEKEIHDHLTQLSDFVGITDVGLRAKTIGLLFETFDKLLELGTNDVQITLNDKRDCGFMYPQFSEMLRDQLAGVKYPEPSAVLVRYHGFESMLVLKERDTNVYHQVEFHKSTPNFAIPEAMRQAMSFICIVDYSRPNTNGYLDTRLIMLLVARGVLVEYLTKLQNDYLKLLKRVPVDPASAIYFLRLIGHHDSTLNKELTAQNRQREIEKMINYVTEDGNSEAPRCPVTRTRILVPRARMVYGVCDPYNELKSGECYFKPTLLHEESECFATENKVVVACRPCYHPGDLRVLKLTHKKPMYENLVDCLVLPGNGPCSHAFMCAEGDLGGSKFFVSWDPQLIPKENVQPCPYSPTTGEWMSDMWAKWWSNTRRPLHERPRESEAEIREEMIEYFCTFKDDLPNRIDKTYTKFAKAFGPSSDQCKQLRRMSYQAAKFTIDRTVLLERLVELEHELSRPASPADESPTEKSGFLENEEEEEMPSEAWMNKVFCSRLSCWSNGASPLPFGDEVWKDFDERTARFLKEVQQEHY